MGGAVNVEHRTSPGDGFFGDLTNEGERLLFNLRSPWYQPLLSPSLPTDHQAFTIVIVRFQLGQLFLLLRSDPIAIYLSSFFCLSCFYLFLSYPSTLFIRATTLGIPLLR